MYQWRVLISHRAGLEEGKEDVCGRNKKKRAFDGCVGDTEYIGFFAVEFSGSSEDTMHMLDCGAVYVPFILENGEYYRIFTSMFLHFGMEHLANNMLALFVLGSRLERTVGKVRFLLIYLLGGITGNLVSLLLEIRTQAYAVSAGASRCSVCGDGRYDLCDSAQERTSRGPFCEADSDHGGLVALFRLYQQRRRQCGSCRRDAWRLFMAVLLYHPKRIRKTVP